MLVQDLPSGLPTRQPQLHLHGAVSRLKADFAFYGPHVPVLTGNKRKTKHGYFIKCQAQADQHEAYRKYGNTRSRGKHCRSIDPVYGGD